MENISVIREENNKIFALLSNYLNHAPDFIDKEEIDEIANSSISNEYAFAVILAAAFGLDIVDNTRDKNLFNNYFDKMIHHLDVKAYYNNPYYKNIRIPTIKVGNSELKYEIYKPFEGFVCNDIVRTKEGRQVPQIGFFETEFRYPAILENDRIWMTITPNEIETMKEPIEQAFGHVLTFGLGLGYYAYMISEKDSVESITVVDNNEDVINLFLKYVLPQFENAGKITIVKADAFEYAEKHIHEGNCDFVFTDLWHDVSDGMDMYIKMKRYENLSPSTKFTYWIEKSILCYL
ncbi:hypothetical protein [Virgibacillus oceani]|uniref:Spermidine synthase n=1 Tax=Virgibacillus oceani TaxID=1479511 RepID=A0A917H9W1_9BACI|nr:hypothetical protein [Virgibacillus oceani]GGG72132.1 hypothetical protein GCM10011398_15590 [Virgibacillus oceani]